MIVKYWHNTELKYKILTILSLFMKNKIAQKYYRKN